MKREFPDHPLVGVGGVVIHRDRVLLIRRGGEPLKGEWSIPGGLVELGEELAKGARRELFEETGLEVEPLEVVAVFDRIMYETTRLSVHAAAKRPSRGKAKKVRHQRRVRYHYVIVDYVCRLKCGRLTPGSDVVDARWVRRADLPQYDLTKMATSVVERAFEFFRERK
jgi:8-oxo-dGTP diphosphatase